MTMLFAIAVAGISFSPVQAEEDTNTEEVKDEPREEREESREIKSVPTLYTSNNGATSTFERIPSPDQIRFFKMIKKDGTALYGIRIDKPAVAASSTKPVKATSTQNKLEKIAGPSLVNLYEKIQRIGNALWGVKKDDVKKEKDAPKASSTPRIITSDISACVISAIEKKDSALKNRLDVSNSDLKEIIDLRTSCQKSALNTTEKQLEYIQACNKTFRASHESILKASKESQKAAWTTYQSDLKACNVNTASSTAPIMIEDGGSNIMDTLAQ